MDIEEFKENPLAFADALSVPKLVKLLKTTSKMYYEGESVISDDMFDLVLEILRKKDPDNKYLKEAGYDKMTKDKVELPFFMPSLDKIKSDTDALKKWTKKYKGKYVVSDKLDGVSALLVINKATGNKLYTKGNGSIGYDISNFIQYLFKDVERELSKIPDGYALRGELIISKKNFSKLQKKHDYKLARTTIAGLLNSKTIDEEFLEIANVMEFVLYSITHPNFKLVKQLKVLKEFGLNVVEYTVLDKIDNDILSRYLIDRRDNGKYEIDGLVVVDNSQIYELEDKKPEYGFAFKMVLMDQVAEALVINIEWNASKHGYLIPTVIIDPVIIEGVEIQRATGKNAKFIVDNVIGIGSKIVMVRGGSVIPDVSKVLTPSFNGKPLLPNIPYKWNESKVHLVVQDVLGEAKSNIQIKKITNFFKGIGVKFLGEGLVKKLVESGYDDVFKVVKAKKEDLVNIDGIGEKLVDKVYDEISRGLEEATVEMIMAGSTVFGRGLGIKKLGIILREYPDIMEMNKKGGIGIDDITKLEGFDTKQATQFVENFGEFLVFYNELKKTGKLKKNGKGKKKGKINEELKGLKIVMTGFRDKDIEKFIVDSGGILSTSVSKKTDLLIYVDDSTSKYIKAVEIGVRVMTLEEFVGGFMKD